MMKKALALAGAGAMLLSMVGPSFGFFGNTSIFNSASVMNGVYNEADSGGNYLGGMCVSGGSIRTGAASAYSYVGNDVNGSGVGCLGCWGNKSIVNSAFVTNGVYNRGDSGGNYLGGMMVGGGLINTGAAGASSVVENFVNWSMIGD